MILDFFLISVIFIASALYSVYPLFQPAQALSSDVEIQETLHLKKRVFYQEIKELDIDYELGNISQEDYTTARDELKRSVSIVIKDIKQLNK